MNYSWGWCIRQNWQLVFEINRVDLTGKEMISSVHQPSLCQKQSIHWKRDTWKPLTNARLRSSRSIQSPVLSVSKPEIKCRNNLSTTWAPRAQQQWVLSGRHVRHTGLKECDQHGRSDGEKSCVITHVYILSNFIYMQLCTSCFSFLLIKNVTFLFALYVYVYICMDVHVPCMCINVRGSTSKSQFPPTPCKQNVRVPGIKLGLEAWQQAPLLSGPCHWSLN